MTAQMARTIASCILQALENLSEENMEKFCFHLKDRRAEPRISVQDVEKKTPVAIATLMISRFTEPRALVVCLETLRLAGCNQEAHTLESQTKARVDKGDPVFRKTSDGKLDMKPSQEAETHAATQAPLNTGQRRVNMKEPEVVKAEAKAQVVSEGGDPGNSWLVLSRYVIQFGKYKGKNFKWLLENDPDYAALLVAQHQEEGNHKMNQKYHMANKDSLTQYVSAYCELSEVVKLHRERQARDRSPQQGQEGMALVGFGRYTTETRQDLYESKDPDKMSYVQYLRRKKRRCAPGSKMEETIEYILQRDQEPAASNDRRPSNSSSRRATRTRSQKKDYRRLL